MTTDESQDPASPSGTPAVPAAPADTEVAAEPSAPAAAQTPAVVSPAPVVDTPPVADTPAASVDPPLTASGHPNPHGLPEIAVDRPEVAVGAAFAGGLVAALILKRLAR